MNNLEKEFIPYTKALELKQLGFDEPCFATYEFGKIQINEFQNDCSYELCLKTEVFPAPTYSQAFLFFRDKHGLYVHSVPEFYLDGINFNWQILWYLPKDQWVKDEDGRVRTFTEGTMLYGDNGEYPTQEEADLACLKKMIEITK